MIQRIIKVVPDSKALAEAGAEKVVELAEQSIAHHGKFSVALSGGSTPKALFELLAAEPLVSRIDWPRWEIYWGDERCVPPDHPDSNYRMAAIAMLGKVPLDPGKIFRMKGEVDPQIAAREYGLLLKAQFGDDGLDLMMLGMGPDCHTLSLFPGTAALNETEHRCVANFVPKFNTWRITSTYPFANRSHNVLVLIGGKDKAQPVHDVLHEPVDIQKRPIQGIDPAKNNGVLFWYMDAAAAAMSE